MSDDRQSVDLHIHLHGIEGIIAALADRPMLHRIINLLEELKTMSGTFSTDLAAQTAAVQALATEVSDGLAANAAAIQALKDQIAAGGTVSTADLTTMEGNTAAIQAAIAALQAALNPTPPPAP